MKLASTLVVSLLDRFSGPSAAVARGMKGLAGASRSLDSSLAASRSKLAGYHSSILGVAAAGYAVGRALAAPVKAAMDFESAMADVKKVVDFETPASFERFKSDVLDMSTRIPMAADALTKIVAAAGQSGIANKDLLTFTELAAKVGVAFDISAETAGDSLAKMMTALNLSVTDVGKLADAMNYLSNSQASSAADILEFFRRAGSDGKMFGFTAVQTSAFGSAMLSAGAEADVASTSFRNMGKALTKGGSATKAQRKAFRALGLDAVKVSKSMQKDAVGTTVRVLEAINKLPKYQQSAIASQLFGDEARALMPLISNLDLLKSSLGMVADETSYAGSASKEYEARAATFANKLQLFQNKLAGLSITVGNALLPALSGALDTIGPFVGAMTDFAAAHPQLTQGLVMATGALLGFRLAAFVAGYGLTSLKVAALGSAVAVRSVGRAFSGVSSAVQSAIGLQTALAGMSGAKYTGLMRIGTAVRAIALAVPGFSLLSGAITAVGSAVATITAPVWAGVAAAVLAVAAAGATLWVYWDRISSVISGVAKRIGEELAPAFNLVQPLFAPIGTAVSAVGEAFSVAGEKIRQAVTWIGSFFSREVLSDEQKAGFSQAGYDVADRMINSVKERIASLVDWFKSLPGRILEAIGSIDIGSLIHWPSPPAWWTRLTGGTPEPAPSPPIAGARAGGGPVEFGKIYEVGERGRELFTPGADGYITSNADARRAGGGSGGRVIHVGGITVNLGMVSDGRSMKSVAEELGSRIRDALDGAFADGTV